MAYYVDFMSFGGTAYRVEIGAANGDPLTGAPEPFVTQEDDGGDLFTPVRLQTGTIRVIDNGSLMASIIPTNNTTTSVKLKRKSSNTTVWEGYLCAAGYSQPWDGNMKMIELPVQSVLSSLYDASIDTLYVGQLMSFSDIINAGLTSIGYSLHAASVADDCNGAWMSAKVNASVFFSKEEISNQGNRQTAYFGKSYGEIIEDICKLFGLMCRDTGTGLLFATYDKPTGFAVGILTSVFTFKGTENEQGFMQGRKNVSVSLSFSEINDELITLPYTTEDSSTVYTIEKMANGVAKVQPHSRNSSGTESFPYYYYADSVSAPTSSTYANCLAKSVVNTPIMPLVSDDPSFVTGAFPVRYSFNPTEEGVKLLANGIMVNIRSLLTYDAALPGIAQPCYTLTTESSLTFDGGYLNIEMAISCFMQTNATYDNRKLQYGIQNYYYTRNYRMFLMLKWGNKYWDGSTWVTNQSTFEVETDGATLMTNLGEDTMSTKNDGLFIPVNGTMSGYLSLSIMNFAAFQITYPNDTTEVFLVNSSIISKLRLIYLSAINETASQRTKNVYRQDVLNSGFAEDNEVSLAIGTMNNNIPSNEFIKSNATTYIETLSYNGVSQRPEMHLLERMVTYYDRVRQTLRAKVGTGLGLLDTLYSHGGRVFVGIDAQHNWRDDTQEVEFIEVRQQ